MQYTLICLLVNKQYRAVNLADVTNVSSHLVYMTGRKNLGHLPRRDPTSLSVSMSYLSG